MAATPTTDPGTDAPTSGDGLFAGLRFFVLQRVPFRSYYTSSIEQHGGHIVKTESQANVILADHVRGDAPDGSLSYTFVDAALKSGHLPDSQAHVIRAAQSRPVGSVSVPAKATRTAFTLEDDLTLWDWVKEAGTEGKSIKGNNVYKELGAINHRHTWQSWRDRYVKTLVHRPPADPSSERSATATHPPSPPPQQSGTPPQPSARELDLRNKISKRGPRTRGLPEPDLPEGYTEDEIQKLLANGDDIANVDAEQEAAAWNAWADSPFSGNTHTAEEWAVLWQYVAKPRYKKMRAGRKRKSQATQKDEAAIDSDPAPEPAPERAHGPALESVHEPAADAATKKVLEAADATTIGAEPVTAPKRKPDNNESGEQDRAKRARTEDASASSRLQARQDAAVRIAPIPPISTFAADSERYKRRLFGFPSPTKTDGPCEYAVTSDNEEMTPVPERGQHHADHEPEHGNNHAEVIQQEARQLPQTRLENGDANLEDKDEELHGEDASRSQSAGEQVVNVSDHGSSPSLTEANLAKHSERYRMTPSRAQDLPEDDEDQDQTEFLEFHQRTTRAGTSQSNGVSNGQQAGISGHEDIIDDAFKAHETWPRTSEEQDAGPVASTGMQLTEHLGDDLRPVGTALSVGHEVFDITSAKTSGSSYASPVMTRPRLLDTQAILNMDTQQHEFDLPFPPDSPEEEMVRVASLEEPLVELRTPAPSDSPDLFDMPLPPSSPEDASAFQRRKQARRDDMSTSSRKRVARHKVESQSALELEDADMDEYITTLQVRDGYGEAEIVEALRRTSMRPDLTELALAEHAAGRGWPDDVPGIWSDEEDAIVLGTSSADINRVAAKMTSKEIWARIAFLERLQKAFS